MILHVHASASYELPAETFLLLMVEPPPDGLQHRIIESRLATEPDGLISGSWSGVLGNPIRRVLASSGNFRYEYEAAIEVRPNETFPLQASKPMPSEIPDEAMVYTWPSRYCQSDLLARLAQSEFGNLLPGGRQVKSVADWILKHVEYRYGTTDSKTSAFDTATERVGVCRDFAHLLIALCRALGIPARYVSGYALGLDPPDFHGYAQVFLDDTWHNVDATYNGIRPALIPIATGRDAADVSMATLWGPGKLVEQSVEVQRADSPASGSGSLGDTDL